MGRLDGKVALISGAARGQGEAEARLFAAEGARVVLGDVLDDLGEKVAADLGDGAVYTHLDVTDTGEWDAAVARPIAPSPHSHQVRSAARSVSRSKARCSTGSTRMKCWRNATWS